MGVWMGPDMSLGGLNPPSITTCFPRKIRRFPSIFEFIFTSAVGRDVEKFVNRCTGVSVRWH